MEQGRDRLVRRARKAAIALTGLTLFVLALEMMKTGARALSPLLRGHLNIQHAADSLGLGWLMAYVVMSGSPAAAIAVALLSARALSQIQAFAMVSGSRLGASLIVLIIGFIYGLRGQEQRRALSTGVLSLLLTASVQLPALAVGTAILRSEWLGSMDWLWLSRFSVGINELLRPVLAPITTLLPDWALFIAGGVLIATSLQLIDKALPRFGLEKAGLDRTSRLIYRPSVMFALGLLVTLLTLSVSVSIGILVPLSARGYVRRENVIPYILGANISTMIDTLGAAVILGTPGAVTVVTAHILSTTIVSLPLIVLVYEPYKRLMSDILEWTMESRRNFAIFMGAFFLVPIALIMS